MTPPMHTCWQPAAQPNMASCLVAAVALLHGFSIAYKMMAIRTCTPPAMLPKTSGTSVSNSPKPIRLPPFGSTPAEPEQK